MSQLFAVIRSERAIYRVPGLLALAGLAAFGFAFTGNFRFAGFQLRLEFFFPDDDDRRDHRLRQLVDLDTGRNLKIRNVQLVPGFHIGDIRLDEVGSLRGLDESLDPLHRLREHRSFFLKALRLADQVDRDGHLDLLTLRDTTKVRVNEAAPERIDLAVLEDDVGRTDALDIQREHGVDARFRTKDSGQVLQLRNRGDVVYATAVNDDRDFPLGPQTAVRVLVAGFLLLSLYYDFFSHISPYGRPSARHRLSN